MKTNITINLFGQLYHIDEDAYQLLKNYEDSMHRYFSAQEGGEEIIDDIEHRVAELLNDLKYQGYQAINIEHIQEIIRRIGNPEEIEEGTEANAQPSSDAGTTTEKPHQKSCPPPPPGKDEEYHAETNGQRKLYRDIKNSMLGGVASGLSTYFGIKDPIFLRIAWVVLWFFPYFPAFIAYIILWILVPPATNPEERLRMQGKAVNPQNMNEEIIGDAQKGQPGNSTGNNGFHQFLDGLLNICALAFKGLLFFILGIFLLIFFFALLFLLAFTFGSTQVVISPFMEPQAVQLLQHFQDQSWLLWILIFSFLTTIGLPLFILMRRMFSSKYVRLGKTTRLIYLAVWLVALSTTIFVSLRLGIQTNTVVDQIEKTENTRNGIYLRPHSWSVLDEGNWEITKLENAGNDITGHGTDLFHDDHYVRYVDIQRADRSKPVQGTILRETEAEAGTYQLEAIVSTHGEGWQLFCQNADTVAFTPIRLTPQQLLEEFSYSESQQTPYFKNAADSIEWETVRENSKERNWSYLSTAPFYHPGGPLTYGVSSDSSFTHRPCHANRFCFYDIVLTKLP